MKRLLFIPMDYHLEPNKPWFDAFSEHFETEYYRNYSQAISFTPDYIFMQSGAISAEDVSMLKQTLSMLMPNVKVIQWTGDARPDLLSEVINTAADITFLASGIAQKEMYEKALQHPVHYLQHAAHEFREVNHDASGIVFVGNNYDQFPGGKERNELCELLTNEFDDFNVYGSGYNLPQYRNPATIPYNEVTDLYNRSYISISASIFNDMEGYWSNRPLDIMAAGSCCLMRYSPNLEKYFTNGVDCAFYHNNEEAVDLIRYLKSKPITRYEMARSGQVTISLKHTYKYRVQQIMEVLNEK